MAEHIDKALRRSLSQISSSGTGEVEDTILRLRLLLILVRAVCEKAVGCGESYLGYINLLAEVSRCDGLFMGSCSEKVRRDVLDAVFQELKMFYSFALSEGADCVAVEEVFGRVVRELVSRSSVDARYVSPYFFGFFDMKYLEEVKGFKQGSLLRFAERMQRETDGEVISPELAAELGFLVAEHNKSEGIIYSGWLAGAGGD